MKLAALLLLVCSSLALAADNPGKRPHPLFTPMDGYRVESHEELAFASYAFPSRAA